MLKKCYCVLTNASELPEFDGDVIGVDKGAWLCFEHGIEMICALGDFDSITEEEKQTLKKSCQKMSILNPRKDVSDSEAAVLWAKEQGYEDIVLVTSMSGRFDHSYVNYQLVRKYGCSILDEQNLITLLEAGTHVLKRSDYRYVSFFACDAAVVSLTGFSYPLDQVLLKNDDIYTLSNELVDSAGTVTTSGKLWCVQSKDKKSRKL